MPGIVVGVDGSPNSQSALAWALNEAAVRHAPLTVLAVAPVAASIFGFSAQRYPADEETRAQVQQATGEIVDKAVSGGADQPAVTVRAVSGLPADELLNASADADLLVVGARGAGGFGRLMMGAVSYQVTQHALCPVVIVPAGRSSHH